MKDKDVYTKVNTFSRTPCFNQIISYSIILLSSLTFWIVIQSNLVNQMDRIILTILFTISAAFLVISGCIASYIDPADPMMRAYKSGNISVYKYTNEVSNNVKHHIYTAIIA